MRSPSREGGGKQCDPTHFLFPGVSAVVIDSIDLFPNGLYPQGSKERSVVAEYREIIRVSCGYRLSSLESAPT